MTEKEIADNVLREHATHGNIAVALNYKANVGDSIDFGHEWSGPGADLMAAHAYKVVAPFTRQEFLDRFHTIDPIYEAFTGPLFFYLVEAQD